VQHCNDNNKRKSQNALSVLLEANNLTNGPDRIWEEKFRVMCTLK
jgi:hypothetical protein